MEGTMSRSPPPDRDDDAAAYRALFENAGVGFFQSTPESRLLRANAKFAHMLGYGTPEEMVAAINDLAHQVHADPAAREAFMRRLDREGRAEGVLIRLRRRDGSLIWASVSTVLIRDAHAAPVHYLGTVVDVTDLIEAREALRRTEESYRSIFENAAEGIYRSSAEGRMLRANPALARLNGYQGEDEMLTAVNDIASEWYVDPRRRDQFKRLMELHGRVQNFESEVFRHKTRERIWISENARCVRDQGGRLLYYEGTVREITARKTAENRMREALTMAERANRTKSEFLAAMSHELRTPLNAIIGFSEIMVSQVFGAIGNQRYHGYLNDILNSARHLSRLIQDLLDLSRLDAGQMTLAEEPVDLRALIDDTVRMVELRARRDNVTLGIEAAPGLPSLLGDRGRLRQIVINLVTNAVKFTPSGGRVVVRTVLNSQGDMVIRVIDTGIGIPAELRARVFEPFFQVGGHGQGEGVGLGLSIVRRLVELHGGTVAVADMPPPGTTIEIILPRSRLLADGDIPPRDDAAQAMLPL
jgi:PAS domain S-box-containing protein